MQAHEYQKLAARTICDQTAAMKRLTNVQLVQLLHSAVGIAGEAGELAGALERHIYYGQALDNVNILEEFGDILWYVGEGCTAANFDMSEVMEGNIRKLQERFPDKYTDQAALEQNRDRGAERAVLEQVPSTLNPLKNTGVVDPSVKPTGKDFREAIGVNPEPFAFDQGQEPGTLHSLEDPKLGERFLQAGEPVPFDQGQEPPLQLLPVPSLQATVDKLSATVQRARQQLAELITIISDPSKSVWVLRDDVLKELRILFEALNS